MSETILEKQIYKKAKPEAGFHVVKDLEKNHAFHQITRTITFEAKRNLKKVLIMAIIDTVLIILSLIVNKLQDNPPEEAGDYFISYLNMISFLIMIIAILFAATIIVEDFEKQTANLLFPKIERGRLLVGRYFTRYIYAAISVLIYYAEIMLVTYIEYEELPSKIWSSLFWAFMYLHLVMSFVTLMSALLNRVATSIIVSIMFLLIVFTIITSILMFTQSTVEPLFIITYYSNIITNIFDMPDPRYGEFGFGRPGDNSNGEQTGEVDDRVFRSWSTPSVEGAFFGIIIYSAILLTFAYLIYRVKQAKSN